MELKGIQIDAIDGALSNWIKDKIDGKLASNYPSLRNLKYAPHGFFFDDLGAKVYHGDMPVLLSADPEGDPYVIEE